MCLVGCKAILKNNKKLRILDIARELHTQSILTAHFLTITDATCNQQEMTYGEVYYGEETVLACTPCTLRPLRSRCVRR